MKSRSIALKTWYALRVDVYADGRAEVFLGSSAKKVLSTSFGSGATGGVGLAVSKGKSLFDDVFIWNGSVLDQ